jgi:hypothetical protein
MNNRMKGCRPSHPGKLMRALYLPAHIANLPPPPSSYDAHSGFSGYRTFLNDRLGDCVVAEWANDIIGLAHATGKAVNIADAAVRENYFTQTGGADNGLELADAMDFWNRYGLKDTDGKLHKVGVYGGVDPDDIAAFDAACYYFDGLNVAIATNNTFMSSDDGELLDWSGGRAGDIDHCVGITGKRGDGCFKLTTWGGVRWVTPKWIMACVGEAWARPLMNDRLCPNGATIEGFDLAELNRQFAVFQQKPLPA